MKALKNLSLLLLLVLAFTGLNSLMLSYRYIFVFSDFFLFFPNFGV